MARRMMDFNYIDRTGGVTNVLVKDGMKAELKPEGLYYTPFDQDTELPVTVFLPIHRILEVFFKEIS